MNMNVNNKQNPKNMNSLPKDNRCTSKAEQNATQCLSRPVNKQGSAVSSHTN